MEIGPGLAVASSDPQGPLLVMLAASTDLALFIGRRRQWLDRSPSSEPAHKCGGRHSETNHERAGEGLHHNNEPANDNNGYNRRDRGSPTRIVERECR